MSLKPLIVASLAAHRAARFVAVDTITEEWRERTLTQLLRPVVHRKTQEINMPAIERRVLLAEMIQCPHCIGAWLSFALWGAMAFAVRHKWRWLEWIISAWAVAGIQSTLASAQAALETFGHVDPEKINDANDAEANE